MPRYEFTEGGSSKFWEIALSEKSFTVQYGKIGTKGQSQTKTFTSEALAKKEYDKLISEKTKKGYALVSGGEAPAAAVAAAADSSPPPAQPKSAERAAPQLRKDLYVYNEATGLLVTSRKLAGKGWDSDGTEWETAVKKGELIPIELIQDDEFVVRVVVGGELTTAEQDEWTGRLDWKIKVPDGKLVVCGGSEFVSEACEASERAEHWSDYSRTLVIPRGEYRVAFYMNFNGINGHACLQSARGGDEPEPLGEWFRKTRPGEAFPAWLHNDCVSDPAEDPGHEAEWKKAARIEEKQTRLVDFLLHLTPLEEDASLTMPALEQGWFSTPSQLREPQRCPAGLVAVEIEGLPKPVESVVSPVDVFRHTQKFARTPLTGGAISMPLERLERLFRLAWSCHAWTMPQIRVELPKEARFTVDGAGLKNSVLNVDGSRVNAGFQSTGGQLGQIYLVAEIGRRLKGLPDGSCVELDTLYYNEQQVKLERPMALHRYYGHVRGGELELEETFPPLERSRLEQALALSAQVESGTKIEADSAEVAEKVLTYLKRHAFFKENPAVADGSRGVAMTRPEPEMLNYVAAEIFVRQFKDAFTVYDMEEQEQKAKEERARNPLQFGNRPALPHGETLLKGERERQYFASDATKIDAAAAQRVADFEKQIGPLGFTHAGDMLISSASHLVVRGYVDATRSHWGVLMVGPGGNGSYEFFCYFQQGGGLTSTRNAMARDDLPRDVFRTGLQPITETALWEAHTRRCAYLTEFYGPLRQLEPTALGLATDYERATVAFQNPQPSARHQLVWDSGAGKTLESGMLPFRRYYTVDPRSVGEGVEQMLAEADATMRGLGFTPLGNLVGTFLAHNIYRGYTKGDTWAKFNCDAMKSPACGFEFVTRFEKENAVLVSLRVAFAKDEPKRKIFRVLASKDSPEELCKKHEARKAELARKFGAPLAVQADLKGLAEELEAALGRQGV